MRTQRGFSLLEILVAATVTALGLAGVTALLLTSTVGTAASHQKTQAAMLARQLAGMAALTPDQTGVFLRDPQTTTTDCTGMAACSTEQFAAYNHRQWVVGVASLLRDGHGLVCRDASPDDGSIVEPACDGAGPLTAKIFWTGSGGGEYEAQRLSVVMPQ